MKREILFRARRIDNGHFECGDLLINKSIYHISNFSNGINREVFEVFNETIGQFTGLTDKNGVKIFEGDIIKYTKPYDYSLESFIGEIKFYPESGYCVPYKICFAEIDEFKDDFLNYIEVIGNIHDNPELL